MLPEGVARSLGISYNLMSFPILQVRLHFCMTNIMLLSESAKYFRTYLLFNYLIEHRDTEAQRIFFVTPDLQSGVIELRIFNPQHPLIIHRNQPCGDADYKIRTLFTLDYKSSVTLVWR